MLSGVRQRCLTKPNRFVTSWNQNYTTSLWFCPHQPSHLLSSTARFESLRTLQQREFLWGAREIKNLRFEVRDERRSLRTSTFPNPMFILVVIAQSLVEADAALQNGFYSKTIQLKVQPFFSNSCRSRFFLPLSTWMAFIWLCFHYYARKGLDLMSLVQTAIDAFDNYQRVSNGAVWLLW